jgi:hypothetical protein
LAERQHGVVALPQLVRLGLSQRAVSHRAAAGRLHRIHRGVYAVGHPVLPRYGRWMAAVLAAGPGAALSHASAAALWEIRPSAATRIDVTVRTPGGRDRPGLRIHRASRLRSAEAKRHHGIRVTTPARTLLDLASSLPRRALERALDQAEILELFDVRALHEVIDAHRGQRGAGALAAALRDHHAGTTVTRSALEESFLALRGRSPPRRLRRLVRRAALSCGSSTATRARNASARSVVSASTDARSNRRERDARALDRSRPRTGALIADET